MIMIIIYYYYYLYNTTTRTNSIHPSIHPSNSKIMVGISKSSLPPPPSRKRTRTRKLFHGLHWSTTPSPFLPHGSSGILLLLLGTYFMIQACYIGPNHPPFGYTIQGPQPSICLGLFFGAAIVNAVSGLRLRNKAPLNVQLAFLLGGLLQLSYVWFAIRFSCHSFVSTTTTTTSTTTTTLTRILLKSGDLLFASFASLFLVLTPILVLFQKQYLFVIPIQISTFALSLTFCYPLQFVIYGEPWLDCVLSEYPYQIPGLVNYIYIPTIFSVSLIFFGFTLLLRHQISPRTFAIFFLGLNLGVLGMTVLTQEIHITEVSTQKLILPCRRGDSYNDNDDDNNDNGYGMMEGEGWKVLEQWLDTSTLAKTVLAKLGIALNTPPTY